ncbi:MAG: M28 family metallopeptidase [Pseudomonadota bacterium]
MTADAPDAGNATMEKAPMADKGVGIAAITGEGLAEHTKVLASDEFEGRSPASLGEERTVRYISEQFEKAGLEPGAEDSWFQSVPLVAITAHPGDNIRFEGNGKSQPLTFVEDVMVWTKRVVPGVELESSPLVFVGYGIVAPEYNWNDYEGLDVEGKTVVMLVNDPGFATGDPALFRGNAMTYYGRWTYKYEEAARQGAAGVIVVHETAAAGYPWEVVSGGWSGPSFDLISADRNLSRSAVEGWITQEAAIELFANAGMDYAQMKKSAEQPGFKPVELPLSFSVSIENEVRESLSHNVIGILPGSTTPDEYVLYMGHWDHLGKDETREGDQIFNGAVDNATGVAALIELAGAFGSLPQGPDRSIIFMAVTAEESGLLGSRHYATDPLYPLNKTVAGINMDALNVGGRTRDMVVVGFGSSELEGMLETGAETQGREIVQEPTPEKGFFYRSDHFNLAKVGVPMLYAKGGIDSVEHGPEWGLEQARDYTANRYHKVTDEFDPDWDWSGTVEDVQLYFMVGTEVARSGVWPEWFEGNEFRAIREASLAER